MLDQDGKPTAPVSAAVEADINEQQAQSLRNQMQASIRD